MSALFSLPTVSLDTGLLSVTDRTAGLGTDAVCSSSVLWCCLQPETGRWDGKPELMAAYPPEHPSAELFGERCEALDVIGVQHVGPPSRRGWRQLLCGYRPGSRVVISWRSHPLPSGSLNEATMSSAVGFSKSGWKSR